MLLIGVIILVCAHVFRKKAVPAVYGERKPKKGAQPIVTGEELTERKKAMPVYKERYRLYKQDYAKYERKLDLYKHFKEY